MDLSHDEAECMKFDLEEILDKYLDSQGRPYRILAVSYEYFEKGKDWITDTLNFTDAPAGDPGVYE